MVAVLAIGGAPRVPIDAVRHLGVATSGRTACAVAAACRDAEVACDLLLGLDAAPAATARRYEGRDELDAAVREWVGAHPDGLVFCAAAVNDYRCDQVRWRRGGSWHRGVAGTKIPSGAEALELHLVPAPKLIDQLPAWGHRGVLVACKYEAADTVLAAAGALLRRTGAALVLANSLCGRVQALVDATGVTPFADRAGVVAELGRRIVAMAG